jgi:hypothetical protein
MAAVGGSIESVSIAGRTFAVAADAEGNRSLGGFSNEVQANGDGSARQVKTRNPWEVSGLTLVVDDDRGDHEFLQDVADGSGFEAVAITFASGSTYQGEGTLSGGEMIQFNTQNSTADVTLSGPGKMTAQ